MDAWQILGIEPTGDETAIRRAYTRLLKQHRPDRDPEGYQRLREAWEQAKRYAAFITDQDDDAVAADEHAAAAAGAVAADLTADRGASRSRAPLLSEDGDSVPAADTESITAGDRSLAQAWPSGFVPALPPVYTIQEIKVLAAQLLASESEGLALAEESWQRVAANGSLLQQQQFHQQLALELAATPGLTDDLLSAVSARFGWGLDDYDGGAQLPESVVWQLRQRVRESEADEAWQALLRTADDSWRKKQLVRLLAGKAEKLPLWARLVPNLVAELGQQVNQLRLYYPELVDRLSPAAQRLDQQPAYGLSWAGAYLIGYWALVLNRSAQAAEPAGQWLAAGGLLIAFYLFGYDLLFLRLRRWPRVLSGWLTLECLLSTALIALFIGFIHSFTLAGLSKGNVLATVLELISVLIFLGALRRMHLQQVPFIRWPGRLISGLLAAPWNAPRALPSLILKIGVTALLYLLSCGALYELFLLLK